jgi:hypothetical protein
MIDFIISYIIVLITMLISLITHIITDTKISYYGGDKFQDSAKKFKKVKKAQTFEDFCYPSGYKVQPQQIFASEWMAPNTPHREILIFHKIGAGKTCLAIKIANKWKSLGKPLFLMPASLIPGCRNELRGPCGNNGDKNPFVNKSVPEIDSKEYQDFISESDKLIDKSFLIYSYNKFATIQNDPDGFSKEFKKINKAPILIVDEVQNISNVNGVFYQSILNWVNSHPSASIVIMSGTPIFDNAKEIFGLAKLLRCDVFNDIITVENIPKLFAGKVSYYAGAPAFTFPTTYIKIKKCLMSKHQKRWYQSEVESEMNKYGTIKTVSVNNDFYIKSRQRSNIVYPNGLTQSAGLNALTPSLIRSSLYVYSCKFSKLIKRLKENKLSFVYTSFTEYGGIEALCKCLYEFGYRNFNTDGPGKRRFAIWSGEQSGREKDLIRATFNQEKNDDGGLIQIIIGSAAIKEGVSLLRVRHLHLLEGYWNHSRLEQIFGRAVRYCSHKSLPKAERDVTIYIYCAVVSKQLPKKITPLDSIDLYMLNIADKKKEESEPYIKALIDVAVDKYIYTF